MRSRDLENIEFRFADVGATRCRTSQCSTILPSASNRKMSMPAQSPSFGLAVSNTVDQRRGSSQRVAAVNFFSHIPNTTRGCTAKTRPMSGSSFHGLYLRA